MEVVEVITTIEGPINALALKSIECGNMETKVPLYIFIYAIRSMYDAGRQGSVGHGRSGTIAWASPVLHNISQSCSEWLLNLPYHV